MKCRDRRCRVGKINKRRPVVFRMGRFSSVAHPCSICGRLHWEDGSPVRNHFGHRSFLLKDGKLFYIDRNGDGYFHFL